MKLGKNMMHALVFAANNKGWHTFSKDAPTTQAIQRLAALGLVKLNASRQFTITSKGKKRLVS